MPKKLDHMASVLRFAEHTGNALGDSSGSFEASSSRESDADPLTYKASKPFERVERYTTESPCYVAFRPSSLHLGEAAIHKQFRSGDVTAVVGGEKHHGLRDLIGGAEPAERNTVGNGLDVCLGRSDGLPGGRVGIARAHRVHANATSLQVRRPCPLWGMKPTVLDQCNLLD